MKDILGKYTRSRGNRKFVYGRIGSIEVYLHPEDDPKNINSNNVLKLLYELDKLQDDYLSHVKKTRKELLSLSPSASNQYKSHGSQTAESETKRRQKIKTSTTNPPNLAKALMEMKDNGLIQFDEKTKQWVLSPSLNKSLINS